MLVQFGPKGSYRWEHTEEYYEWALPAACPPTRPTVVLADWFAPNVDGRLQALVESKGMMLLNILGYLTGFVQVNDTRLHAPLAAIIRQT